MKKSKTVTVKLRKDGIMCFIPVPFDPKQEFGKVRAPVKVTLAGHSYRSTIFSMGGKLGIPLRKSNREAAGLNGDEELKVTIALDNAVRKVTVPPELARAFRADPATARRWAALSYTHRREHAEAILDAKKPETRARRIAGTLRVLKA